MKVLVESSSTLLGLSPARISLVSVAQPRLPIVKLGVVGPAGPAPDMFEHLQSSPSSLWVVNHNFGRNPVLSVVDSAGREIETDVLHTSLNQVQVSFNLPMTGKAIAR